MCKRILTAGAFYDYMCEHHYGTENAIKRNDLADNLQVSDRTIRAWCKEINETTAFEKLISTSHSIYVCRTEQECKWSIIATYKQAISLFRKAKTMEKKVGLNGQVKIGVDKGLLDSIVETFEE